MKVFERIVTSYAEVLKLMKRLKEAGYGDVDWSRTRHGFKVQGYPH